MILITVFIFINLILIETSNSKVKTDSMIDKDDISFNYSEIEDDSKFSRNFQPIIPKNGIFILNFVKNFY